MRGLLQKILDTGTARCSPRILAPDLIPSSCLLSMDELLKSKMLYVWAAKAVDRSEINLIASLLDTREGTVVQLWTVGRCYVSQ